MEANGMKLTPEQARQVWYTAAEKVKDRVIAPSLYRALEAGVGITLDGDLFVLGFAAPDAPMAGHLRSAQHNAIILQALEEVLKTRVRLLIIDGTTLQDYENYKRIRAASDAVSITMSEKRARQKQIEQAWEEISEKITRTYAKLNLRQLAQVRGRFINDAFNMILEGVKQMDYTDDAEEIQKRSLARVFEKLGNLTEVPAAMLAYEFFKLRDEGKLV